MCVHGPTAARICMVAISVVCIAYRDAITERTLEHGYEDIHCDT